MTIDQSKNELYSLLKIDEKKKRVREIEAQMNKSDFWLNHEKAQELTKELSDLNGLINQVENAQNDQDINKLNILAMFSGIYDKNSAVLSIHAGAGGTEAQDWAQMLLRMYERWADNMGFRRETIDVSLGEEAGIKSATILITGLHAFGWLKSEAGVHRLVRLSPFDADHARHTSFALVELVPEISNDVEIEVENKDLRIDVFKAGGHGGQGVNTTDSAVRITHIPTGIVVACQNERSQMQNKEIALKILKSKLHQLKIKEKQEEEAKIRGEHISAGWGNQIRSYVLHPYKLVKDHRTDFESTDPEKVLDGDLNEFMVEYLKKIKG